LVIAILQSIPAISPLNPFTAIAPLVFVIGLSMARDAYEDYKRYKLDDETNKKVFKVLKQGQFREVKSADIKVGDILLMS
jgi:magnesium-transporting ATPase (P-type)